MYSQSTQSFFSLPFCPFALFFSPTHSVPLGALPSVAQRRRNGKRQKGGIFMETWIICACVSTTLVYIYLAHEYNTQCTSQLASLPPVCICVHVCACVYVKESKNTSWKKVHRKKPPYFYFYQHIQEFLPQEFIYLG